MSVETLKQVEAGWHANEEWRHDPERIEAAKRLVRRRLDDLRRLKVLLGESVELASRNVRRRDLAPGGRRGRGPHPYRPEGELAPARPAGRRAFR